MANFVSLILWTGKEGWEGRRGKLHNNDDKCSSNNNNSAQSDNGNKADANNTHLLIYAMLYITRITSEILLYIYFNVILIISEKFFLSSKREVSLNQNHCFYSQVNNEYIKYMIWIWDVKWLRFEPQQSRNTLTGIYIFKNLKFSIF